MVRWGCCSFFWVSCFGQEKKNTSCDIMGVSAVHHRLCHFHFPQRKTAKKHTMTQCCWERLHRWNMFNYDISVCLIRSTTSIHDPRLSKPVLTVLGAPGLALATRIAKTNQHSGELCDVHIAILVQIKEFVGTHHTWWGPHPYCFFCYHHPSGLPEATIFYTCTFDICRLWMPHSCFE